MPRIAIAGLCHESNTFAPGLTQLAQFRQRRWQIGDAVLDEARGVAGCISGLVETAEAFGGYQFVPTFAAGASPSGRISATAWQELSGRLIDSVVSAGQIEALYLDLHGAGVAEDCDDIEGALLAQLRQILGPNIPIVATLDLHANLSRKMVESADLLIGLKCYPHTDYYERGCEAMQRLHGLLNGSERPVMSMLRLPLLLPPNTTLSGPAGEIAALCAAAEQSSGILNATFFHGFAHADISDSAASVLCIADGDADLAQAKCRSIADQVWAYRAAFQQNLPGASEGVAEARRCLSRLAPGAFPIVINEVSDNPGSGAPGDGTRLLAAMLEADLPSSVFCHIADPEVVAAAYAAGVGTEIRVTLGGKVDDLHGAPLPVTVKVINLCVADYRSTGPMEFGRHYQLGRSAWLRHGNVDIIVAELKMQMVNIDLLNLHQVDYSACRLLGLKSAQHFRAYFQQNASRIIPVDTGGLASWNLAQYGYLSDARYRYPLGEALPRLPNHRG